MSKKHEKSEEYFDRYKEKIDSILDSIKEDDENRFSFVKSIMKNLLKKEYDAMTFMFYSICLIKQFGVNEKVTISKETYEWFENEIQSGNRIVKISHQDQEDDSLILTLCDIKWDNCDDTKDKISK